MIHGFAPTFSLFLLNYPAFVDYRGENIRLFSSYFIQGTFLKLSWWNIEHKNLRNLNTKGTLFICSFYETDGGGEIGIGFLKHDRSLFYCWFNVTHENKTEANRE